MIQGSSKNEMSSILQSTFKYTEEKFTELSKEDRETLLNIINNLSSPEKEIIPISKNQITHLKQSIERIDENTAFIEKTSNIFQSIFSEVTGSNNPEKKMNEVSKILTKVNETKRKAEFELLNKEDSINKNYAEKEIDAKISVLFYKDDEGNDHKLISIKLGGHSANALAQGIVNDLQNYAKLSSEEQLKFRGLSLSNPEKNRTMLQHFARQAVKQPKETKAALEYLIQVKEAKDQNVYFISDKIKSAIEIMKTPDEVNFIAEKLATEVKGGRGVDIEKLKMLLSNPSVVRNETLKKAIIEKAEIIQIQFTRDRQLTILTQLNQSIPIDNIKEIKQQIWLLQDQPNNGNNLDGINGIRKIATASNYSFPDEKGVEQRELKQGNVIKQLFKSNITDIEHGNQKLEEIRILKCPNDIGNKEVKDLISSVVGVSIDSDRNFPIPQQIHRFWSGGQMSEDVMKILIESAAKTESTPWKNTLWFSSTLEKKLESAGVISEESKVEREKQRDKLRILGYEVKAIEEIAKPMTGNMEREEGTLTDADLEIISEKASKEAIDEGAFRWDGIKHLSDIARLMYIHELGGHHFDVDMGLGNMDLNRAYYHNDSTGMVPLFGSVTAVSRDPIAIEIAYIANNREQSFKNVEMLEAAKKVVTQACDLAPMLNGMIASHPKNSNMTAAIESLRSDALITGADLPSGMSINKILLGGPNGLHTNEFLSNRGMAVPVYLLDVQHLSSESENR